MPGALDKIVAHELDLRRQSAEAKARKAPAEEARRRADRAEKYLRARQAAGQAALNLTGRVLFPARWDVTEGDGGWLALVAAFDGKIEIRYFWHPYPDKLNWLKEPSRQRLVEALITWGLT